MLDLGYSATVGLVAAAAGAASPAGGAVRFLVHPDPGGSHEQAVGTDTAGEPAVLQPGSWAAQARNDTGRQGGAATPCSCHRDRGCTAVACCAAGQALPRSARRPVHPRGGACNGCLGQLAALPQHPGLRFTTHTRSFARTSGPHLRRFVEVRLASGSPAVQLCELQVHLLVPPALPWDDVGGRGGRGRKLAGAAFSLLAGAATLAFLASLSRQRQAAERQQAQLAGSDRAPSLANYPCSRMPASGETLSSVAARSRSSGGSGGSGDRSRAATGSGGSLGSRVLPSSDSAEMSGTPRRTSQLEAAAAYISGVSGAQAVLHCARGSDGLLPGRTGLLLLSACCGGAAQPSPTSILLCWPCSCCTAAGPRSSVAKA